MAFNKYTLEKVQSSTFRYLTISYHWT